MIDNRKLIHYLADLEQLEIDAVLAYDQAIRKIDVPAIRSKLARFKDGHKQHITELSKEIRKLGGEPPAKKPDLKGLFITGFTAIRSLSGTEGALKAMRNNERFINRVYHEALYWEVPPRIRQLIQGLYKDLQRPLFYIETTLAERRWEAFHNHQARI